LACAAILIVNPATSDTPGCAEAGQSTTKTTNANAYNNSGSNSDTDAAPGIAPQNDHDEHPKPIK